MNILCANCEHRTERRELMRSNFARLGFSYNFLTATYWRDYETFLELIESTSGAAKEILYNSQPQLDRLNIAALIATWARGMERIRDSGIPTIFCVDDYVPVFHTSQFDDLADRVKPWNVISFWVHSPVGGPRIESKYKREYPELMRGVGGAGDNALMVTPNGAAKLLSWMYENPCAITETMLNNKARLHQQMGYIDPSHYWIDHTKQKWFSFTEHFTESDTGLTGVEHGK